MLIFHPRYCPTSEHFAGKRQRKRMESIEYFYKLFQNQHYSDEWDEWWRHKRIFKWNPQQRLLSYGFMNLFFFLSHQFFSWRTILSIVQSGIGDEGWTLQICAIRCLRLLVVPSFCWRAIWSTRIDSHAIKIFKSSMTTVNWTLYIVIDLGQLHRCSASTTTTDVIHTVPYKQNGCSQDSSNFYSIISVFTLEMWFEV